MNYRSVLAEGKRLITSAERDGWRLCELTFEVVEAGISRAQWARDLGVNRSTISRWYSCWSDWGSVARTQRPSVFEAMQLVAGRTGEGTKDQLATSHARKASPEAKVQIVREALKEKPIADKVFSDVDTRLTFHEAAERRRARREDNYRKKYPTSAQLGDFLGVTTKLNNIGTQLAKIAREIQDYRMTRSQKTYVTEAIERIDTAMAFIRSYAYEGKGTLDEEIQALLGGER